MKPTVNLPKIAIPTGYEQQQRDAATKRRLAEAMLGQGLGPRQGQNNWSQLFGQLASAYAGKKLNKDATNLETGLQQQIQQDFSTQRGAFQEAIKGGATPAQIVEQFGASPLLEADVKPYREAVARGLTEREQLINFGGRSGVRQGDVAGQFENDPNKPVHVIDGQMQVNPVAMTAQALSNGTLVPEGEYPTSAPFPGAQSMAPQQPQPQAQPRSVDAQGLKNLAATMPRDRLTAYLMQGNVVVKINSPEEADMLGLPPGTKLELPDGTYGEMP